LPWFLVLCNKIAQVLNTINVTKANQHCVVKILFGWVPQNVFQASSYLQVV
jgi:hypothetical protein